MKGIREVYTTEQLYEELRPRLSLSDGWLAQQHPELLQVADAMVEALQKKESYGGGVAQRAAHLAGHLKAIDCVLGEYMAKRAPADAAAAAAAGSAPAAGGDATTRLNVGVAAAAAAPKTDNGTEPQQQEQQPYPAAVPVSGDKETQQPQGFPPSQPLATDSSSERPGAVGEDVAAAAAGTPVSGAAGPWAGTAAAGSTTPPVSEAAAAAAVGEHDKGIHKSVEKGSPKGSEKGGCKGGAATALEYLTTTFAHLREQRTLVMGDRKDRLLKEVAGLRQLRAGNINVLRGASGSETTMGQMLSALKEADVDYVGRIHDSRCCGGGGTDAAAAAAAAASEAVAMEVDGAAAAPSGGGDGGGGDTKREAAGAEGGSGNGNGAGAGRGALDNLTCVVWEDWRVPERLSTLLRAGDSVCVHVEVHCRDGPEDTRLAMRLSTFVALALCSQRLIAELYQDMFIVPQRAAAARPQRKRQRTAAEETVQTLDESPDSLDFVDFVEALHRRMPLRCGWMYANAIMPTAVEWDQVFGRRAGRLSGLFEGGTELDALGRACLAFHQTRHESPVLDVHILSTQLRQQKAKLELRTQEGQQEPQQEAGTAGGDGGGTPPPPPLLPEYRRPRNAVELAATSASAAASLAAAARTADELAHPHAVVRTCTTGEGCTAEGMECSAAPQPAAAPKSLILRPPGNSSGRGHGLDLGHLSCCCITAAPLSDDFLGELIRQTTAGQAAAEVAAASAAAAAARAKKCAAAAAASGDKCPGTCAEEAAAAAAAADVAAAAVAMFFGAGGAVDEEEEAELFDAVKEELMAVEEAAEEAQHEVEVEIVREVKALAAAASGGGPAGRSGGLHHLKGAFSHRMQLLPGVFFSYFIGSQAFTNTAWHVEDFLLQSINLMLVGRPKAWWWVPRDKEQCFRDHLEDQWDTEDIYTKSVPLAAIPLEKLIKLGVRRSVQLPGMIFVTSPGYAFHTTMSSGWSMADSANFMANVVGKDMHVLEDERPLEQYPETEGLTSTGEWVRFTMRRIEELRAANDPTYTPKQLTRRYAEAAARKAAAAKAARGIKKEEEDDPLVSAGPMMGVKLATAAAKPPPALKAPKQAAVKTEGGTGAKAPQSKSVHARQSQPQQQHPKQQHHQESKQPVKHQQQPQQQLKGQDGSRKAEQARPSRRRAARSAAPAAVLPAVDDAEDALISGRAPERVALHGTAAGVCGVGVTASAAAMVTVKEEPCSMGLVKEEPTAGLPPPSILGMDIDLQAACAMQEELLRNLEQPQLPQTRPLDITDEDMRQAELALQFALFQQRQATLQQQQQVLQQQPHAPQHSRPQQRSPEHQQQREQQPQLLHHAPALVASQRPQHHLPQQPHAHSHPQQQQPLVLHLASEGSRPHGGLLAEAPEAAARQDESDGGASGVVQVDMSWRVAVA